MKFNAITRNLDFSPQYQSSSTGRLSVKPVWTILLICLWLCGCSHTNTSELVEVKVISVQQGRSENERLVFYEKANKIASSIEEFGGWLSKQKLMDVKIEANTILGIEDQRDIWEICGKNLTKVLSFVVHPSFSPPYDLIGNKVTLSQTPLGVDTGLHFGKRLRSRK